MVFDPAEKLCFKKTIYNIMLPVILIIDIKQKQNHRIIPGVDISRNSK